MPAFTLTHENLCLLEASEHAARKRHPRVDPALDAHRWANRPADPRRYVAVDTYMTSQRGIADPIVWGDY